MRHIPPQRFDRVRAQQMLDEGQTMRTVAHAHGVSTQTLYELVKHGKLTRPTTKERK